MGRPGETPEQSGELTFYDYRFLRWCGLTRDQAGRRLKLSGVTAKAMQEKIDADPLLDPSFWIWDVILDEHLVLMEASCASRRWRLTRFPAWRA